MIDFNQPNFTGEVWMPVFSIEEMGEKSYFILAATKLAFETKEEVQGAALNVLVNLTGWTAEEPRLLVFEDGMVKLPPHQQGELLMKAQVLVFSEYPVEAPDET